MVKMIMMVMIKIMMMMMMMMMMMVVMTKSNLINNKWLVRARYAVGADISESWGTVSVGNCIRNISRNIINSLCVK